MRKGQMLPFVLLIGGVLALIGAALSFFISSGIQSVYGFEAANRALAVATAGVEDALIQLVRNKDFSVPSGYTVPLGSFSASVTVVQNSPAVGQAKITSYARVSRSERTLEAIVSISSYTGELNVRSLKQL